MSEVAILIPVFNVRQHIDKLLGELTVAYPTAEIITVDDGSNDGTAEIIRNNYREVKYLRHEKNRGKGQALKTGLEFILTKLCTKATAFIDGDGQHDPEELRNLIAAYKEGKGNFIIGKRDFSFSKMPVQRICSNFITSNLLSLKLPKKVSDSQCGFRLVDNDLLREIGPLQSTGFELETELLLKAGKLDAVFYEVPISTIYDTEKSNIKPIRDIYRFIRTYLAT